MIPVEFVPESPSETVEDTAQNTANNASIMKGLFFISHPFNISSVNIIYLI